MSKKFRSATVVSILFFGFGLLPGCGQDSQSQQNSGKSETTETATLSDTPLGDALPITSIRNSEDRFAEASNSPALAEGSGEWLIGEIKNLRKSSPQPAKNSEVVRRERNKKIVDLATMAVSKSHEDPAKEHVFNEAVVLLMEARMDLALDGDQEQTELLYSDAASIHKRAPNSKAAAEAAFALARFAHANARKYAKEEPRWLEEFSRQSRLFATNFPHEKGRAVSLLYAAGYSCELHNQNSEATACYALIQEKFPESAQAKQVTAVLRRFNLKGKPLQLAGPTMDGKFISIDDNRGKIVLIAFWSTGTNRFREHLPKLAEISERYKSTGFSIIGVNLDEDEDVAKTFAETNSLSWPQIFYSDPKKRRWNNPIVKYYGVRDVPMFWLVDRNGLVVDTHLNPTDLESKLQNLLVTKN